MAALRKRIRVGLVPPEITYFNLIKNSIGKDPLVTIDPLISPSDGVLTITIRVKGLRKARALATLLVLNRTISIIRIRVRVRVVTSNGTPVQPIRRTFTVAETIRLYQTAFATNRLFRFSAVPCVPENWRKWASAASYAV